MATNRKEIVDNIFGGYAQPAAIYRVRPGAYFFDANVLKPDPYDAEGAKKLLTEAGYPSGFTSKWRDNNGGGLGSTLAMAIAGYWRKIGVNAEVTPIETATMTTMFIPNQKPEVWNSFFMPPTSGNLQFENVNDERNE